MSKLSLTRVIAGAALGCATVLIGAPGIATADSPKPSDSAEHKEDAGKEHQLGWIFAHPEIAKPGHPVLIVEICKEEQEKPWAWSKATGKLMLEHKADLGHRLEELALHLDEIIQEHLAEEKGKAPEKGKGHEKGEAEKNGVEKNGVEKNGVEENGEGGEATADGMPSDEDAHEKEGLWVYGAVVHLPKHVKPGKHLLKGGCAHGELIVAPNGAVDGGDGGAGSAASAGMIAGGTGALAAALLGGTALLRRRSADGAVA